MPDDATRDFGGSLRAARERSGVSLRAIAVNTKISMPSLEALERNDVSRLPGGIFLRAFVRAYAKEVGLDPEDTVRRFVARFPDAAAVDEPVVHEPVQQRSVLGDDAPVGRLWRVAGWSVPFVLLIVYVAFGGRLAWLRDLARQSPPVKQQAEQVPPSPDTPVLTTPISPAVPPERADGGAMAGVGSLSPGSTTTSGSPPPPGADAQAVSNAAPGAGGADAIPAAARPLEALASDATDGRFTMTLTSRQRCWVTVRSNGKIVFSGTMQPGDRQQLALGGSVSLTVGNAAAMAVELDGRPARPLGGEGEVRTVRLTAQNLKDFLETR